MCNLMSPIILSGTRLKVKSELHHIIKNCFEIRTLESQKIQTNPHESQSYQ